MSSSICPISHQVSGYVAVFVCAWLADGKAVGLAVDLSFQVGFEEKQMGRERKSLRLNTADIKTFGSRSVFY